MRVNCRNIALALIVSPSKLFRGHLRMPDTHGYWATLPGCNKIEWSQLAFNSPTDLDTCRNELIELTKACDVYVTFEGCVQPGCLEWFYTCYPGGSRWGLLRGQKEISRIGHSRPTKFNVLRQQSGAFAPAHCHLLDLRSPPLKPEDCSLDEQSRAVHKSCLEIRNTLNSATHS